MKTHPRHCKPGEQPCTQEHVYHCAYCGNQLVTFVDSFWRTPSGIVLGIMFWPACSLPCYRRLYAESGDTNPNAITWAAIGAPESEGYDPNEPIDFNDLDDQGRLEALVLEDILATNPHESEE